MEHERSYSDLTVREKISRYEELLRKHEEGRIPMGFFICSEFRLWCDDPVDCNHMDLVREADKYGLMGLIDSEYLNISNYVDLDQTTFEDAEDVPLWAEGDNRRVEFVSTLLNNLKEEIS